jgi:beta-galactosidase
MNRIVAALLLLGAASCLGASVPFDNDWRFFKGDAGGAEQPGFNDAGWQTVALPHDWSIAGPFDEENPAGGAGGFLPSGVAWYRKEFTLPKEDAGQRVMIEFDGVMANSDVWINGCLLGHRPSGYVAFAYDMTSCLHFDGGRNVVAVRADTSKQPASRWYAGAGIYRHVRLLELNPVHLDPWGVFITTPEITPERAVVRAFVSVTNPLPAAASLSLELAISDAGGRIIQTAKSGPQLAQPGSNGWTIEAVVAKPDRWDIDHPALYRAALTLREGNTIIDTQTTPFGIREIHFDPGTGFWLNGRNFKLKGVCLHADGSCFGAAVPLGVWERRLRALRELGVNAIRTAHNPPAAEFLDLCDREGMLVMDEFFDCWTVGKNKFDYHLYFTNWSQTDARDTIRRDRNHPSIILYSVGNEIHDTPKASLAYGILKGLVEVCHGNDPTRLVTQALFRPNVSGDYTNGLADLLDVIGTNYRDNELLAARRAKPSRKIIGTEQRQDRATWLACRDHPDHAGQFLWTGVDYLGESRRWPVIAAGAGLLDRCGRPRPVAFERQSWWSDKPMVFIARRLRAERTESGDPGFTPLDRRQEVFADWTPRDAAPHEETVEVYGNCGEVELLLNGRSLGSRSLPADASPRVWQVPFEPGELAAIGKNNGQTVASNILRTAGAAAKIVLTTDAIQLAANWDDLASIRAVVTDAKGVPVPSATNLVTFSIDGPGVIAAVDSADNASHEPFQSQARRAFQGECFAWVRALPKQGEIRVKAAAENLEGSVVTIAVPAEK